MERPKVIIVGGLDYNIPKELRERFEIVRHYEQRTGRIDQIPSADYIFVITDFVKHSVVDAIKNQVDIPIIWLAKGWSHMKVELQRRSILPPDSGPEATETAPAQEASGPSIGTTGLSEDELWKQYKERIIEAVKGALKPSDVVAEKDLLDILADLVGVPTDEMRPLLSRLHMSGILVEIKDGFWSCKIGRYGFMINTEDQRRPRRDAGVRKPPERALKIAGLRMGPYASVAALIREMQKYEEFHIDGHPISVEGCRKLVKKGIEIKLVDDTHEQIYVDHKDDVVLKRIAPEDPPEPKPLSQMPPSPLGALGQMMDQIQAEKSKKTITKERAEQIWREVVEQVKVQRKPIGTILENGRIEWMVDSAILCCLVPHEYSMYMRQLDAPDVWGLVSSIARDYFGSGVVIRFLLDNAAARGRA